MSQSHVLHVEGHKLGAIEFNPQCNGPAVIFLHGITSSPNFWIADQLPIFQESFNWFTMTLPGHYPAVLPSDFQPYELSGEVLARVLAKGIHQLVGDRPVIIVGYSTGGFAAVAMAAFEQQRLNMIGAVSIAGFVNGKWNGPFALLQQLARSGDMGRRLFRLSFDGLRLHQQTLRLALMIIAHDRHAFTTHPTTPQTVSLLYEDLRHLKADEMLPYFMQMPDVDITPALGHIHIPTLVMTGDCDPIVAPKQSMQMAAHIRHSQLVVLRGAGHLPISERYADYHQHLNAWINSLLENTERVPLSQRSAAS